MKLQCRYSETESNMELAVGRRRPYGPPLPTAHWLAWYLLCRRVVFKINKYLISSSEYWKIPFPVCDSKYFQLAIILWICWHFSKRKLNVTASRKYLNLDFIWGVCIKIFSLVCVLKTNVVLCSLLTKYSQILLRQSTLYFLTFFSQLHLPVPFRSNV